MTHICDRQLTNIGSGHGLSPGRRQAIIWTNARMLLIGPLGANFSEISIGTQTFSFKKRHLKMSSAKWRPVGSASMSYQNVLQYWRCQIYFEIIMIQNVQGNPVLLALIHFGDLILFYKMFIVFDAHIDIEILLFGQGRIFFTTPFLNR